MQHYAVLLTCVEIITSTLCNNKSSNTVRYEFEKWIQTLLLDENMDLNCQLVVSFWRLWWVKQCLS